MGDLEQQVHELHQSGGEVADRIETAVNRFTDTVADLGGHVAKLSEHLATLQVARAAEEVPAGAREAVHDVQESAGAVGGVAAGAVDVPLAASHDVIRDSADAGQAATTEVKKAVKKRRFGRKR